MEPESQSIENAAAHIDAAAESLGEAARVAESSDDLAAAESLAVAEGAVELAKQTAALAEVEAARIVQETREDIVELERADEHKEDDIAWLKNQVTELQRQISELTLLSRPPPTPEPLPEVITETLTDPETTLETRTEALDETRTEALQSVEEENQAQKMVRARVILI
jgi:hypothetical protein